MENVRLYLRKSVLSEGFARRGAQRRLSEGHEAETVRFENKLAIKASAPNGLVGPARSARQVSPQR